MFLDGRVELQPRWIDALARDLAGDGARSSVACSTGSSMGVLDVAYRRSAIDGLGPFAQRTDGWSTDFDMQLRLTAAGFTVEAGSRRST